MAVEVCFMKKIDTPKHLSVQNDLWIIPQSNFYFIYFCSIETSQDDVTVTMFIRFSQDRFAIDWEEMNSGTIRIVSTNTAI